MSEQRKAVIKNADMSEDMQQDAVDCASQALSKYNIEKVSFGMLAASPLNNSSFFWEAAIGHGKKSFVEV